MNCPFCEQTLKIPEESLASGEFHYDCPFCNSSLLFEKGECQVLVEGALPEVPAVPEKAPASETPPTVSETILQESGQKKEMPEAALPEPPDLQDEAGLSKSEEILQEASNVKEAERPAGELEASATEKEAPLPPPSQVVTKEKSVSLEDIPLEDSTTEETVPVEEDLADEAPTDEIQREEALLEDEEENTAGGVPFVDKKNLSEEIAGFNEDSAPTEPISENSNRNKKPEDFSDIERFGNISGHAHKGPFYYNLIIEEINSKQSRQHLEDVLSDEGLTLPPIEIKDGALKLLRISPAACHVIVKSLLGWPFQISWEQELVADQREDQTDPAHSMPPEEPDT